MKQVWICGDSILRGVVWSPEQKRYITTSNIRYPAMEEQFSISIRNRSRFGCTLEKGIGSLLAALDRGEKCDVAILELGGNDSDFNWAEISQTPKEDHFPKTLPALYEQYYREAVAKLRQRGIAPVLCNVIPVCSHLYLNWVSQNGLSKDNILHWLGDEEAIFRYQAQYSSVVDRVAKEENCPLIDLRSAFLQVPKMEDYFCPDGIHPNEAGQALIDRCLLAVPRSLFGEETQIA